MTTIGLAIKREAKGTSIPNETRLGLLIKRNVAGNKRENKVGFLKDRTWIPSGLLWTPNMTPKANTPSKPIGILIDRNRPISVNPSINKPIGLNIKRS